MASINFNGNCFNYQVDVDQGRIWLEDDVTKQQWQWLSHKPPKNHGAGVNNKQVPDRVFLAAVNLLFRTGPLPWSGRVQLDHGDDGVSLLLHVDVPVSVTDWRAKETLVLEPLPVDETEIVRARLNAMHTTLAALQREVHGAKTEAKFLSDTLTGSTVFVLAVVLFGPEAHATFLLAALVAVLKVVDLTKRW